MVRVITFLKVAAFAGLASGSACSGQTLGNLPHPIAVNATITPFTVNITDDAIENLKAHLRLYRPPRDTYESVNAGWEFGVPKEWLVNATDQWLNNYDWRAEEAVLNSIPQYKVGLTDDDGEAYSIHFAGLFSNKKDAIPLVMSHGFPDSYQLFMPFLQMIQAKYADTPDDMPYHIIVPSLVGTGFSSPPPLTKPFYTTDMARIMNKFMVALGFGESGYIAHGTDVSSMIVEYMLEAYDEVKAAHATLWWGHPDYDSTTQLPANEMEVNALKRLASTTSWGVGNVAVHRDRSSTIGHTIGNSPISILTWVGERYVLWADPSAPISMTNLLTDVSLYWFTETYPTSYWCYAQFRSSLNDSIPTAPNYTGKRLAYSWFANDVSSPPSAYFKNHSDIYTDFYQHDKGGHFVPMEQPEALWADLTDFIPKVWAQ
ncbi:hypothetical protein CPAR01_14008 [Colletotrichum paranaense]|uniref:Epoxide hydrolase N-terminal domain-containing protein n=1 Tax=Colletotrichum paranaense TaxID=1914294 RepID=A0ABQ9S3D8_9PEZI|nr:uncharacterized protein CPAR01_14008 [Colletotrichum paranaense]KAK1523155.1 hypothetical protein CPAR01_14008 [Colletotrichum paranaense]